MSDRFFIPATRGAAVRRTIYGALAIAGASVAASRVVNHFYFPDLYDVYGDGYDIPTFFMAFVIAAPVIGGFFSMSLRINRLNAVLADQVIRDGLTSLLNRSAFRHRVKTRAAEQQRDDARPDALLLIDIDHFKRVNDTYGHAAGDQVLRVVAFCIHGNAFDRDYVARLGGEEFAVYLKSCGANGAARAAERIRAAIEECQAHHEGRPIRVTASVGTALMPPGSSYDTTFKMADHALYRAKASGRNRCEFNGLPSTIEQLPDRAKLGSSAA